ncbi:Flp pilus assembly protein CpaB [Roseococcus sp. DSY-14]|uniref:Flp pilus assembly protein CpaB n=1 Tax=Roseococcus sp. DSY-14 TaxID=3369650 RepID=UPI00387AB991
MRLLLLGLLGLSMLGVLGLGAAMLLPGRDAPPPEAVVAEAPRPAVLAAARPLRAGSLLRPEDLAAAAPGTEHPGDALPDTPALRAAQLGAMVRRPVAAGEALRAGDLLPPGDRGFLAAVLAPDRRAIAVQVDAAQGAANLIWPGDRVDVILTQQLQEDGTPAHRRVLGETALRDLRVIAVDQGLVQGAVAEAPDPGNRPVRLITLEVTPPEAERLAVAGRLGRLSLVVRAAIEGPAAALPPPGGTWGGDVSPGLRLGREEGAPQRPVQVFLGATRREEFRF